MTITDESLIPDQFCTYTLKRLTGNVFNPIVKTCSLQCSVADVERVPNRALIEAELQRPCEVCRGSGRYYDTGFPDDTPCASCGGSGKRGVPGARLDPRGVHLEIK